MSIFENKLKSIEQTDPVWHQATVDVCDTADLAFRWLAESTIPFTASDVIALADLILQREKEGRDA